MDNDWSSRSNVYYRKIIRKDNDAVSLDADMIRLLIAIDENKNLYQIAEEVDMGTAEFKKALSKLVDQGLIEAVQKDIPVLDQSFMETLRINLSRAIGPMAEILIEDQADEMEINPTAIPIVNLIIILVAIPMQIQWQFPWLFREPFLYLFSLLFLWLFPWLILWLFLLLSL